MKNRYNHILLNKCSFSYRGLHLCAIYAGGIYFTKVLILIWN